VRARAPATHSCSSPCAVRGTAPARRRGRPPQPARAARPRRPTHHLGLRPPADRRPPKSSGHPRSLRGAEPARRGRRSPSRRCQSPPIWGSARRLLHRGLSCSRRSAHGKTEAALPLELAFDDRSCLVRCQAPLGTAPKAQPRPRSDPISVSGLDGVDPMRSGNDPLDRPALDTFLDHRRLRGGWA
jgi:hypothetical protein